MVAWSWGGMGLGSVQEKALWGRGRERSGLRGPRELDLWAGGQWSLTEGLPRVDVNDEARDLVSAQDLVVRWAKENKGGGTRLQAP